jgi:hypothetical protein
MSEALNITQTQIEELVWLPLQVDAGVWTAISITIDIPTLANQQNLMFLTTLLYAESPTAWITQLINSA